MGAPAFEVPAPLLYRAHYKYRFEREFRVRLPKKAQPLCDWSFIIPSIDGGPPWVQLRTDRWMIFRAGYCYDGPSGPTKDSPCSMGPAAFHDGCYQGARLSKLPQDEDLRELCDDVFKDYLIHDGMSDERAELWYQGVQLGAGYAWKPQLERVYESPSGKIYLVNPGGILVPA